MADDIQFQEAIKERFRKLPHIVQQAIVSADVSQQMRKLADEHKLHIDQWETLENEVQYTLLGIQPAEELAANIQKEVGVDDATATSLAEDISKIVFEPIREELERQLEHPSATAAQTTGAEQMREKLLADAKQEVVVPAPVPIPAQTAAVAPVPVPVAPAPPAGSPAPVVPASQQPQPIPASLPATAAEQKQKVERASLSPLYITSQASHERKTVEGDPYREQIV